MNHPIYVSNYVDVVADIVMNELKAGVSLVLGNVLEIAGD
jgi:hypothetical protein